MIQLYDFAGRLILSEKYEAGNVVLDMSQQPAGVYFLRVDDRTVKVVKE